MTRQEQIAIQAPPEADSTSERGITFRSVALGLSIVILINLWVTYAEAVVHASRLNLSFFQITLLALFLVLVGVVNPLLKLWGRRFAFAPSELLVIVVIGMVGSVVPTSGVTGFLMGVISTPIYFATPENGWAEFFHPHIEGGGLFAGGGCDSPGRPAAADRRV